MNLQGLYQKSRRSRLHLLPYSPTHPASGQDKATPSAVPSTSAVKWTRSATLTGSLTPTAARRAG
ncbi:hypothetical protein CPB86DRAFT_791969 [Serendipita vermifera]|nr:hypothetical protein CPB86DRAFT_791969 [Serendipita vermifera]